MINVFQPTMTQSDFAAVARTFDRAWLGPGKNVAAFEAAWALHIGVDAKHVVSTTSCTEALFQIVSLLGLAPLDEVIVPSIHFIGAANAVLAHGASLVLCDVDPVTLNPDLEHIEAAVTMHTTAVILLHYGSKMPRDIVAIRDFCNHRNIVLIEDAACAQMTRFEDRAAGTWGNFGAWSFDAMKVMTSGDGGMIYCEQASDADALRRRMFFGMGKRSGLSSRASKRWWEFESDYPGRMAAMNDVAASIGLSQLQQLAGFVDRRLRIARHYNRELSDVMPLVEHPDGDDLPYYFYWVQTWDRDALAAYLREHDIYTTFRYYPLHRVFGRTPLARAEQAAERTLLLPLHASLSDADVQKVIDTVKAFYHGRHSVRSRARQAPVARVDYSD